ncbi:CpsD/CapB family tyrosine-protein kinase [Paenibacillus glycanilyticus]|uniref:non-specific protein-tyrosine kinase n=1 Tax=Paenibacillus glycanilyticus TaxID=126569 RepID=A0ABQ6GAR6_9BACL|nr:CpsD/CapB family tyrosine-protein kinase [Paenibacillus glycanilyticus]GLX66348.1 capsular polysaccharide biosynthesis protein [Paenibacillus glycanilyticus]
MRRSRRRSQLFCLDDPKSPVSESYKALRTNLQYIQMKEDAKVILVTSSLPEEGKSTTVSNLAVAFAQSGKSVLLVDCDLRKPNIHKIFGESNEVGLTDILMKRKELEEVVLETVQPNLFILTSGMSQDSPAELLEMDEMKDFMMHVSSLYDLVIVDSPPLLPVTDGKILAKYADGVVLVIHAGKTLQEHVKKAKNQLDLIGANIYGAVLNQDKSKKLLYYQ